LGLSVPQGTLVEASNLEQSGAACDFHLAFATGDRIARFQKEKGILHDYYVGVGNTFRELVTSLLI
jgi:hypothetical protein